MSKRKRRSDPADPAQWLGQAYTPHDPYYYVTGRGRFLRPWPLWTLARSRYQANRSGCLLWLLLVGSLVLIVAALTQTNETALQIVLLVVLFAVLAGLAGALLFRFQRKKQVTSRHPKRHR